MATFEIRHSFDINEDDFWKHAFLDREFNQELYLNRLGFARWEVLEDEQKPDGTHKRKIRTEPKADAPAAVRKLVGDSFTYVEEGSWDPNTKRYTFRIEPSKLANKIEIKGEMWTEAKGDKKVERVVRTDANVGVFGVGKIVEQFIEKQTRDSYETAAVFTREWAEKKGL